MSGDPGAMAADARDSGPDPDLAPPAHPGGSLLTCVVPADAAGDRVDKVLAAALTLVSRSRLRALLEQGCVRCAGTTITDPSQRVKPGQRFDILVPDPTPAQPEPQALPLAILFEDEDVLVVDKPAGLVVHPAPGNRDRTLVNALLAHCGDRLSGIGGVCRPGIVHRLDKDTSGLLVVAKSERGHAGLAVQFGDRTIRRTYLAVAWGLPAAGEGVISGNIGRSGSDRKKMAVVGTGGKPALTRYRVVRGFGAAAALVECRLETGRTHQIRVHLASIGHPLVGDPLYGRGRTAARTRQHLAAAAQEVLAGFGRQALHARRLEFRHPTTGQLMTFEAPVPEDMERLIKSLEGA